ncbi:hypothetical protein J3E71DRAFT_401573 [Bipolaris maydis]|nr:hypothetical protein J3E71DRAFT_401573 [Bipolaris maydis]
MEHQLSISMLIAMLLLPLSFISASIADTSKTPQKKACGWELMQNLTSLGTLYAKQTGDRSLCTRQDDGSEYCTCIYECGNGVWSYHHDQSTTTSTTTHVSDWTWERGCGKYCHAGVCDGQV